MRQVLMLEKSDIETMRNGHMLSLTTATGVVVELGILGARFVPGNGAGPGMAPPGREKMLKPRSPERAQLVAELKQKIGPRPKINSKQREAYPEAYRRNLIALARQHGVPVVAQASGIAHSLIRTWFLRASEGATMRKDKP